MTLFGRLVRAVRAPETRDAGPADPMSLGAPLAGRYVSPLLAENLSAVLGAVGAISTALASLPALVYRLDGGSRVEAPTHPLARLIAAGPNEWQCWPDLVEWTLAQALLHGNALLEIETDGRGAVSGLVPIPWGHVSVQMLPSGRLVYDVVAYQGPFGGTGRMRRLLDSEIVHLRDRSDDGLVGRSRLSRARTAISTAMATQDFTATTYENSARPGGVLKAPGRLSPEAAARLSASWKAAHAGGGNVGKTAILEEGIDWAQMSMTNEDAELLASRKFSTEEVARIFAVPPPIIQDYSHNTFTNSQAAGRWFAQFTLLPWVKKLEAGFRRSVLGPGYALGFDLSEFMRGDDEARWQAHKIAVEAGILDPDEIREIEGWNPRGRAAA